MSLCANRVFKSESYPLPLDECDKIHLWGFIGFIIDNLNAKDPRFLSVVAMIAAIVIIILIRRGLLRLILSVSIPSLAVNDRKIDINRYLIHEKSGLEC